MYMLTHMVQDKDNRNPITSKYQQGNKHLYLGNYILKTKTLDTLNNHLYILDSLNNHIKGHRVIPLDNLVTPSTNPKDLINLLSVGNNYTH